MSTYRFWLRKEYVSLPEKTTPTSYSNDAYPDIVYLLVFSRLPLQARLGLRAVCRRWRDMIEADTAQMRTLRVFGDERHLRRYIEGSSHRNIKPTTEASGVLKYDPNPWNSLILSRPSYTRDDLTFLLRLFPSVTNLALAWTFGEERKEGALKDESESKWIEPESAVEPNIFALLLAWSPNLTQLYLSTPVYAFKRNIIDDSVYFVFWDTYLDRRRTCRFWQTLNASASSLTKLSIQGVHLNSVPEWFTLPNLTELSFNHADWETSDQTFFASTTSSSSANRLAHLAPDLQCLRIDMRQINIWNWNIPSTVTSLALSDIEAPKELLTDLRACHSVRHMEIGRLGEVITDYIYTSLNKIFSLLPQKFPAIASLRIVQFEEFTHWLARLGRNIDSVGFLITLASRPASPLDSIKELSLGSFTHILDFNEEANDGGNLEIKEKVNCDHLFRGLAITFKALESLTISIEPEKETVHQLWYGRFSEYQRRYMPQVRMRCILEVDDWEIENAFDREPGDEEETSYSDYCYLSSGCAFGNPK